MFHRRVRIEEIEAGDHLCVRRMGLAYAHHGVYLGEGRVAHYSDAQGLALKGRCRVLETSLEEFVLEGTLRRVFHPVRSPREETVRRARRMLDSEGYSLLFNNCEHFATYCATGRRRSHQIRRVAAGVAGVALGVAGLVVRGAVRRRI